LTVPRIREPFDIPQVTSVSCIAIEEGPGVFVMVTLLVRLQSLESLTSIVCNPSGRFA